MREVALGFVCDIKNGYAFKSSEFKSEGVPLLRISSFNNGPVYFDDKTVYVDDEYLETKSAFKVEKGDVLIALSGATTGKFGLYTNDKPSLLNQRIGLLKSGASQELDDKYFYFYLSILKSEILRKAGGAAQPNISTKAIGELKIPLPPLDQQKQIAKILDTADGYRQKTKALIKKYDELTQSLFLDMFDDPVTNPKEWKFQELKSVTTKIGSGSTPKGGKESYQDEGISLIRSLNVYDNKFKYENLAYINNNQADKLKHVAVEQSDVLFNITGASICRSTVVPIDVLPARVNQHVSIIRPDYKLLNSLFLNHLLISENVKTSLLGMGSGGGAVMQAITKKQLTELRVIIPPISLQNQFAERVKAIEAQKALAKQELDKADDLFNSLLQKAFKGELVC